jgi:hypothetical protein
MTEVEPDNEELEAIGEWLAAGRPLPRPRFQVGLRRHLRREIASQPTQAFDALGRELSVAEITPSHAQAPVETAATAMQHAPAEPTGVPAGGLARPGLAAAAYAGCGAALLALAAAGLFGAGPFGA